MKRVLSTGLISALLIGAALAASSSLSVGGPGGHATATAQAAETSEGGLRVYVIVVDSLRPQEVSLATPTLNELKSGGTWYEQARAVFPAETVPNHAAMMTG